MALFDCIECGVKISDKAQFCPHCGCPKDYNTTQLITNIICEECENQYDRNLEFCPNCGCPNINNDSLNNILKNNNEAGIAEVSINNEKIDNVDKTPEKNKILLALFIIGCVIFYFMFSFLPKQSAINLVKYYQLYGNTNLEENVHRRIENDSNIEKIYGWNAKRVDKDTYFVSYDFDDDTNKNNGYIMYCFEAKMNIKTVYEVTGSDLEQKYIDLEFINE